MCAHAVHFLPERHDRFARGHRIGIAVADQNAWRDRGGGEALGVEQAVEAGDQRQIRARTGEFQHGLPAHAEADGGERQALRRVQPAQGGERGGQPGAVMIDIRAQGLGQRTRRFEAGHRRAIEIGDHGEVAGIGQHARAAFDRRGDVGDGREHQHRRAGDAGRAGQPARQRGIAVGVGDGFELDCQSHCLISKPSPRT